MSSLLPANVRMKLVLIVSAGDEFGDLTIDREFRLGPGEVLDLGDVELPRNAPVTIQVVDDAGAPLRGIPVRSRRPSPFGRIWSSPVKTDAAGHARLHGPPGSTLEVGTVTGDPWTASEEAMRLVSITVGTLGEEPVTASLKLDTGFLSRLQNEKP